MILALLLAHAPPPPVIAPASGPPAILIDQGICPGECCKYQTWTSRGGVDLLNAPGGTSIVATLSKGDTVTALTGEVHVSPIRAEVKQARTLHGPDGAAHTVKPGDAIWLLEQLGGGQARIWVNGGIYQDEALFWTQDDCQTRTDATCWAVAPSDAESHEVWWAQVKTQSGIVGWVDNSDGVLTGFDDCQ